MRKKNVLTNLVDLAAGEYLLVLDKAHMCHLAYPDDHDLLFNLYAREIELEDATTALEFYFL